MLAFDFSELVSAEISSFFLGMVHLYDGFYNSIGIGPVVWFEFGKNQDLIYVDLERAQPWKIDLLFSAEVVVFIIFEKFGDPLKMFGWLHLLDNDVLPLFTSLQHQVLNFLKVVKILLLVVLWAPGVVKAVDAEFDLDG